MRKYLIFPIVIFLALFSLFGCSSKNQNVKISPEVTSSHLVDDIDYSVIEDEFCGEDITIVKTVCNQLFNVSQDGYNIDVLSKKINATQYVSLYLSGMNGYKLFLKNDIVVYIYGNPIETVYINKGESKILVDTNRCSIYNAGNTGDDSLC